MPMQMRGVFDGQPSLMGMTIATLRKENSAAVHSGPQAGQPTGSRVTA